VLFQKLKLIQELKVFVTARTKCYSKKGAL
jgi:hypothetical protein